MDTSNHIIDQRRLIQSADYILDRAAVCGRNVERQRQAGANAATRVRPRQQLRRDEDRG